MVHGGGRDEGKRRQSFKVGPPTMDIEAVGLGRRKKGVRDKRGKLSGGCSS